MAVFDVFSPPPPMMVMHPLLVNSAKVEAMPNVPLAKASNSNTPTERERERERERKREERVSVCVGEIVWVSEGVDVGECEGVRECVEESGRDRVRR